jgi:hypothetical protein
VFIPQKYESVSVAVKKGAILAPLAPRLPAAFQNEPFSLIRRCSSDGPERSRARRCWAGEADP